MPDEVKCTCETVRKGLYDDLSLKVWGHKYRCGLSPSQASEDFANGILAHIQKLEAKNADLLRQLAEAIAPKTPERVRVVKGTRDDTGWIFGLTPFPAYALTKGDELQASCYKSAEQAIAMGYREISAGKVHAFLLKHGLTKGYRAWAYHLNQDRWFKNDGSTAFHYQDVKGNWYTLTRTFDPNKDNMLTELFGPALEAVKKSWDEWQELIKPVVAAKGADARRSNKDLIEIAKCLGAPHTSECSKCGKKSWSEIRGACSMIQPNGTQCKGVMIPFGIAPPSTPAVEKRLCHHKNSLGGDKITCGVAFSGDTLFWNTDINAVTCPACRKAIFCGLGVGSKFKLESRERTVESLAPFRLSYLSLYNYEPNADNLEEYFALHNAQITDIRPAPEPEAKTLPPLLQAAEYMRKVQAILEELAKEGAK